MKNAALIVGAVIVVAAAGWFARDTPLVQQALHAVGLHTADHTVDTGAALAAAGVHKCKGPGGITYLDHACPKGSVEVAANGGTVTVMALPKAPPPAASAASGGLVKGFSQEEIDRMRDRQIEAAANR